MKKIVKPDVVELINKMQEQIAIIDRKIDTLISKASIKPTEPIQTEPRPVEPKSFHKPFQQHDRANGQNMARQDINFVARVLHKAVCAECKKGCEVPFKPSGERPVYCKECFSKRKARGPFGARPDNRPRVTAPVQAAHIHKPEVVEKKKPAAKKRPASKKKKK